MKIEDVVSFTLQVIRNESFLRDLFEASIEEGLLLSFFHEVVPYNIIYSTDEYIDELLYHYHQNDSQAIHLTSIILKWFRDYKFKDMSKDYQNLNESMFYQKYNNSIVYFFFLLSGKYHEYVKAQKNTESLVTLPESKYKMLSEQKSKNETSLQIKQNLTRVKRQINEVNEELREKEIEIEKYRKIFNNHKELQVRYHLMDKKIILFIGNINMDKLTKLKQEYFLKELRVYSSLDNIPNNLQLFNYVIFSTQIAKHSTYYQVKNSIKGTIFHTDKLNVELIFEELISYIQERELSCD